MSFWRVVVLVNSKTRQVSFWKVDVSFWTVNVSFGKVDVSFFCYGVFAALKIAATKKRLIYPPERRYYGNTTIM